MNCLKFIFEWDGVGLMFDNMFFLYFFDNGEMYYSYGMEWLFIVLVGDNILLDFGWRYICLLKYGVEGYKMFGNWYMIIFNVFGNLIEYYGVWDVVFDSYGVD